LLITDGLANIGITDSSVIRQKVQKYREEDGISISTFGVGLDYNESLLTDMAETGTGNYYFIDNPDNMVSQFNKEMNGLLNVVAQAAELRIKIPEGVKVEKSYPLKFSIINDVLVVRLRDLFAEETKSTLFTLKIADHVNKSFKLSCTLSYTDVMDGKDKSVTNDNLLLPAKLPDPWLTHFNKNVIEQAILFTANENLELAMQEVDRGNFDRGGTILQGNNSYFRAARYYVNGNRSLQTMDSINRVYQVQASRAKFMNSDSLKKIQKFSKALNYQMRNKKQ
jgi:Ca-activated chloride channel family protein